MRAIGIHRPAGISGLACAEVPDATPMTGDVLVKVAAYGTRGKVQMTVTKVGIGPNGPGLMSSLPVSDSR